MYFERVYVAKGSAPWFDSWLEDCVINIDESASRQEATITCKSGTNMSFMFYKCSKLTSLDLSNFGSSNVTRMHSTFSDCSKLTTIDLSNFDTSKVWIMQSMFENCSNLTTIKGVIDMKSCNNCYNIFRNCPKLKDVKIKNPPSWFARKGGLSKSQYTIVS